MKYSVVYLAVLTVFACEIGVQAQEPYIEFVQGLRAKGLPQYALDYLERLSSNPPAELAKTLLLEKAKA